MGVATSVSAPIPFRMTPRIPAHWRGLIESFNVSRILTKGRGRMSPQELISVISGRRFNLGDEKVLQSEIAAVLTGLGIEFKREVRLGPGDIVDFMFSDGLVAEVKIKAARRAIYLQCKRYCAHETVSGLVLITATALGFPEAIDGKPTYIASLGRAWL
jgi:hypothetical protein